MSDPLFDADDDGSTLLDPDEGRQLSPTYITTRAQLNEAEQIGIANADIWAFARKTMPRCLPPKFWQMPPPLTPPTLPKPATAGPLPPLDWVKVGRRR